MTPNPVFEPTAHGKPWSAAQHERYAAARLSALVQFRVRLAERFARAFLQLFACKEPWRARS